MKAHFASRNRLVRRLILPALAALACSGGDASEESLSIVESGISVDQVLGFEVVSSNQTQSDWILGPGSSGSLSSSTTHTQGLKSLQISNLGWAQIQSTRIGPLGQVGTNATLDLRVSGTGTIPWGDVILQLDAPSQGLLNAQAGQKLLGGMARGTWHSISIPLSQTHRTKLSAPNLTDLSVRFSINLPSGSTALFDRASFGQPPGGSGGTGGTGGSGGSSGASGAAGTSGSSGASGASGASGGSGGSGATSGSAGSSGSGGSSGAPDNGIEFFFQLPNGVAREAVALDAYGGSLTLEDYSKILTTSGGFSSASAVASTTTTSIGAHAELQSLWSQPNVLLKSNSRVHGSLTTQGALTKQTGATVDGTTAENTSLDPLQRPSWLVTFPSGTLPSQTITTTRTFAPGAYGATTIKPWGKLIVSAGTYTFKSLSLEGGGTLEVDNRNGPVFVYVETTLGWSGTVTFRDTAKDNVLFGVAGTATVTLVSSFRGVLVAPYAHVTLGACTPSHHGAFFAKSLKLAQGGTVKHRPFTPASFCPAQPTTCDGLCPCDGGEGTCVSDADCSSGLVCWKQQGRRFNKLGGSSVCANPECIKDPVAIECGRPEAQCGRCTNQPTGCTSDSDCITGEVCGTDNGWHFGLGRTVRVCWPIVCEQPATTSEHCGTGDAACGTCDCRVNCTAKSCGDDPADGCGGYCPGLCDNGEPGCTSNIDCPAGSVCGGGVGPRFGHAAGTNACWPASCAAQDPSRPNGGVDPAICGVTPTCVPDCENGATGPDGCGGFCASCGGGQVRLPNGNCVSGDDLSGYVPHSGTLPPLPLPPLLTDEVGATAGSFRVNARGQAQYTIPIVLPSGRRGMVPTLSLQYTSTKENGMLGIGWSLAGLSAIGRCGSIQDANGSTDPITHTTADSFCLDGQRLIQTCIHPPGAPPNVCVHTHSYGEDGADYRTEVESFTKVISRGQNPAGGPEYFEVMDKEGRIKTYGSRKNSRLNTGTTRVWALDRIQDRSGNTIEIQYESRTSVLDSLTGESAEAATGELLPSTISYGANPGAGVPHSRFVSFAYEEKPDPVVHYVAGHMTYSKHRLTFITSYVNSALARRYRLNYSVDPVSADAPSQLESVTECGPDPADTSDGEACKAPTVFEYYRETPEETTHAALEATDEVFPAGLPFCAYGEDRADCRERTLALAKTLVVDHDGDGRDDLLTHFEWSGQNLQVFDHVVYFARGAEIWGRSTWRGPPHEADFDQHPLGFPADWRCLSQDAVFDMNRDGKDDLLNLCEPMVHLSIQNGIYEGVALGVNYTVGGVDINGQLKGGAIKVADVTGDGLRDVVWCTDSSGQARTHVAMNLGSSPPQLGAAVDLPVVAGSCRDLSAFDADRDGDDDLVILRSGDQVRVYDGGEFAWHSGGIPPTRDWRAAGQALPSNDPTFFSNTGAQSVRADAPPGDLQVLDLNGDGLRDILVHVFITPPGNPRQDGYAAWMNQGGVFQPQYLATLSDLLSPTDWVPLLPGSIVVDFDGDGRDDVITQGGYLASMSGFGVLRLTEAPVFFSSLDPLLQVRLVDFDGDGERELLAQDGLKFFTSWRSARSRLLRAVTDGLGRRYEVEYEGHQEADDATFRTYSAGSCISDFNTTCERRLGPLVSSYRESQVEFDQFQTPGPSLAYTYSGARTGLRGRGSFGVGERTETVHGAFSTTDSFHNQSLALAGRVNTRVVRFASNPENPAVTEPERRIEESGFNWAVLNEETNPPVLAGRFTVGFPFLIRRIDRIATTKSAGLLPHLGEAGKVMMTVEDFVPDEYGNVASRTMRAFPRDSFAPIAEAVSSTPRINDPALWLLGLVDEEVITSTRGGLEQTRKVNYSYDADSRGLLTLLEREPDQADDPDSTVYRAITITPDALGNAVEVCRSDSRGTAAKRCSTVEEWDPDHVFPVRVLDPEGMETSYQYASDTGQVVAVVDPNGIVSKQGYDAFGRPQQVDRPTGKGTVRYFREQRTATAFGGFFVHGALGVRTETEEGVSHHQIFDAFGRLVSQARPGFSSSDVVEEFQYDPLGRRVLASSPHDPFDASDGFTSYDYDSLGRVTKVRSPEGLDTDVWHVDVTRIKSEYSWFDGSVATSGTVTRLPRGNTHVVLTDPQRLVAQSHQDTDSAPGGEVYSRFTYGPFGKLVSAETPSGATTFHFDNWGRREELIDPALGTRGFTYNGFDEVVTTTDSNGTSQRYAYDKLGRMTALIDVESDETLAEWDYDGDGSRTNELGRLVGAWRIAEPGADTGNWVRRRYQSGPHGLLEFIDYHIGAARDEPSGGEVSTVRLRYQDTVPWRLEGIDYPDAGGEFGVNYGYDARGNLDEVVSAQDSTLRYWTLAATDHALRVEKEVFGNGIVGRRDHFSTSECVNPTVACTGLLKSLSVGTENEPSQLSGMGLHWDANKNLVARTLAGTRTTYGYDLFDRLTSETIQPDGEPEVLASEYQYYPNGDIHTHTAGSARVFEYVNGLLDEIGSTSYHHDGNGNQWLRQGPLAPGGRQEFEFNDFDMPWHVTTGEGSASLDTKIEYGADESRIVRRDRQNGADSTTLFVAELYERFVSDAAPTEHRYRVYAGTRQIAEVVRRAGEDEERLYIHDDERGSVQLITNQAGEVADTRTFGPFGTGNTGATSVLKSFTGHSEDRGLGLVNMRGRLYDPTIGRFLTPDPLVSEPTMAQGWNRYAYVSNNPFSFTDPSGFKEVCIQVGTFTSPVPPYNTYPIYGCHEEPDPQPTPETPEERKRREENAQRQEAAMTSANTGRAAHESELLNLPPSGDPWDAVYGFVPPPRFKELPASGPGYAAISKDRFGEPELIALLQRAGQVWSELAPDGVSPILLFADLSQPDGGPFKKHINHLSGRDVDIPVIKSLVPGRQYAGFPKDYSPHGTQLLVDILRGLGGSRIRVLFFADTRIQGVDHDEEHYTHLHLSIRE